jgi:hypothetical protein
MPRGADYRYYYKCLERYFVGKQIQTLSLAVLAQCVILFIQGSRRSTMDSSTRRRKRLSIIGSALCIQSLHDKMTKKCVGTYYPTQGMQNFDEELFFKMYRFRRLHFYQMLAAMKLDGNKSILCGRTGSGIRNRAQHFPADICLMIMLRRMAFPCRFVDLVNFFGLPTNRICDIYHSTIDFLYFKFARKLNRFEIWKEHFPAFAQAFRDFGAPYDHLSAIFDGHNIECCRPGGLGNLNSQLDQSQLYSGEKANTASNIWLHSFRMECCSLWPIQGIFT